MDTFIEALKNLKAHGGHFNSILVKGVLEGLMDGVLILTQQSKFLHVNSNAQKIIERLTQTQNQFQILGQELRRIYQAIVDGYKLYPDNPVVIESEIRDGDDNILRIRARLLQLDAYEQPLVLIVLEDQNHSIHSLATTESKKYGLTPRETEIWLLRRANRSYKEIAAELYISLNTVKKHVKSIRSKLKFYQFQQDSIAS
ncbi:LuxR C-terminal-related transcriptional regulator [Leptothoe sp. LEGE 181152]|nr:LuxR C-terminal-related transcriptional regulator [Leptothoe sp. LEGE 181152]